MTSIYFLFGKNKKNIVQRFLLFKNVKKVLKCSSHCNRQNISGEIP